MGNSRIIKKHVIYYLFLIVFSLNAQTRSVKQSIKDYQLSSEQYISGTDGKVYMNVSFGVKQVILELYEYMKVSTLLP